MTNRVDDEHIEVNSLFEAILFFSRKLIKGMSVFFNLVTQVFLSLIRILKKYIIIIVGLPVIFAGYSIVMVFLKGDSYEGNFSIQLNYSMNQEVYDKCEYLVNLLENKKVAEVCEILNLPKKDFSNLSGIDIEPIINKNEQTQLYDNYLKLVDTSFYQPMDITEYIKSLEPYDYRVHKITLKSKQGVIPFKKIQAALLEYLGASEFFERKKELFYKESLEEIAYHKSIITELDSTLHIDNQVKLNRSMINETGQNHIQFGDDNKSNTSEWIMKEYMIHYHAIKELNARMNLNKDLISLVQQVSGGKKVSNTKKVFKTIMIGLAISLLIIFVIQLFEAFKKL